MGVRRWRQHLEFGGRCCRLPVVAAAAAAAAALALAAAATALALTPALAPALTLTAALLAATALLLHHTTTPTQVQANHASPSAKATPDDIELSSCSERPKSAAPTALRYKPVVDLLSSLGDDFLNKWVLVTDGHMDIDDGSSYFARVMARTKFIEGMRFQESDVLVHVYNGGGPYPRVVQVAVVMLPMSTRDLAHMHSEAKRNITTFATRHMQKEFFRKLSSTKLEPAALRAIWRTLDQPHLPDLCKHEDIDDRCQAWMALNDPGTL